VTVGHGAESDAAVDPEARPRPREGVATQKAGSSLVLLDVDSGLYFSLDEVGERIWSLCDGRSVREIVDGVCSEYDADRATVENDVLTLLGEFRAENLIGFD
jgi:coenzyme PQQ synthesis protein D (PqqD)